MTYQEKKSLITLISSAVLFVLYFLNVYSVVQTSSLYSTNPLKFYAIVVLMMVVVQVIAQIIVFIIFIVINKIITDEDDPNLIDELDKLIELKSTKNFLMTFLIAFFISMISVVLGGNIDTMFVIILGGFAVAGIVSGTSEFLYYRRGV